MHENGNLIIKRIIAIIVIIVIITVFADAFVFILPLLLLIGVFYCLYKLYFGNKSQKTSSKKNSDSIPEAEVIKEKFDK